MKRPFALTVCLAAVLALHAADIPQGYYDAVNGTKDSVLKSTLSLIVRGGTRYDYGTTTYHSTNNPPEWYAGDLKAYGTWQALPYTDHKPGTRNGVWDMYSNCVRYYPNKLGDSGCSLNIEHCLPKSWWGGTDNEAYKDLYNLNPSDQRANGQKSNYAPGHVSKGDKFDNGSFRMDSKNKSTYGYICWEPAEEYRGDFARTYFYMATAYEYLTWTAYPDYISNASYLMFSEPIQQVLLDWHRADPVSDKERCRMDWISDIQGNRNPFIDYPDLVEYIWGNRKGQSVDLSALTCAFHPGACPDDATEPPAPPCVGDTLINLPAITAALVNAVTGTFTGSANSGIQSNGNASITMGKSTTDGEITFTGLLDEDGVLIFRASPYNSATGMQLDVYANDSLLQSVQVTVTQDTRDEIRYEIDVPAGTTNIRLVSVGGSTSKRACMQELYLLRCNPFPTDNTCVPAQGSDKMPAARKQIRDGQIVIVRNASIFTTLGQLIQ
jgi:hypothetical protein